MVDRNLIDYQSQSNDPKYLVSATVDLGSQLEDVTVKEVVVGESLLNPSAHAVVTLQSAMYFRPTNWNAFRCQPIRINIKDNRQGSSRKMTINQHIYRCENRHFTVSNSGSVEELTLHSIDESILKDAETIMEKSWKCSTPSAVVSEAMDKMGVTQFTMNSSTGPARPYVAESIHPLQVIQQQANVALYNGDEKYGYRRQARMGMLERDKIALRITIPWTPSLHVGQQIRFHWYNRYDQSYQQYGSGRYLILHMTHNIQYGGYAVTNLDCIANTFGTRD